jgi:ankyrin repeat protein
MGHRRLRVSWGTPERRAGQTGQDQESLILDTVTVAVRAGVDLNASDAADQTALAFAKARRYDSVVAFLLTAGARE